MDEPFVMPKPVKRAPIPERVTVYDAEGNAFEKFPVDAAECVQGGEYFYEKQAEESLLSSAEQPDSEEADQEEEGDEEVGEDTTSSGSLSLSTLTKAQLLEVAKDKSLPATVAMKKDEIIELIEGAK